MYLIHQKKGEKIMRIKMSAIVLLIINIHCYSMDTILDGLIEEVRKDLAQARQEIGTVIGVVSPSIGNALSGEPRAITNNPYKDQVAYVRQGTGISLGEKEYLKNRLPIVKASLEKLLKRQLQNDQIPNIVMIHSGGGYRAMHCTTGSLYGAKKIGLLDATTYQTGLSGSTWAIAPWISTGMPLKKFKQYIIDCASQSFTDPTDAEELLIFEAARVKSTYGQPKTPVDLYGDLLGNRLLSAAGDDRHMIYLSEQAKKIQNGKLPYPIYTAIDGDENIVENQTWYEFTPHEIGNPIDNVYVPTWGYGRKFKEGKSVDNAPEKNLSYHMGTWGSAFGASIKTVEKETAKTIGHWECVEKLLEPIEGERPLEFYALIASYAYKMNTGKAEPKTKKFVDAGLDFNLPVSPISGLCPERKADVMIICDASAGTIGNELRKTAEYMKKHNLPFPQINLENIDKKTISVFKDKTDPNVPVVIYLPRISDQQLWENNKSNPQFAHYNLSGFDLEYETNHASAETIHFQYNPPKALQIIEQTEFNMRVNEAKIIKALNFAVNRKNLK
jgi:phospholipase A2